jgi:hypothetical protein
MRGIFVLVDVGSRFVMKLKFVKVREPQRARWNGILTIVEYALRKALAALAPSSTKRYLGNRSPLQGQF